jgi:hypothetical protein
MKKKYIHIHIYIYIYAELNRSPILKQKSLRNEIIEIKFEENLFLLIGNKNKSEI